jgi:hypothetical protein
MMPQLEKLAQCSKMADMDKEWSDIQKQMQTRDMPYARIKEYVAVCLTRQDCRKDLDQVVNCLINILKIEEEQALSTKQELKDILMCLG